MHKRHECTTVFLRCMFSHVNVFNYCIYILLLIEQIEIASPRHINRIHHRGSSDFHMEGSLQSE